MSAKQDKKRQELPTTAPAYRRLDDAHYAALDELEKVRHQLHIDVDAIIDAYPYAELDQRSVGFRPGRNPDSGSARSSSVRCEVCEGQNPLCAECDGSGQVPRSSEYSDPTSDLAFRPGNATAGEWLAEAKEARAHVTRTANRGRYHYGFDPEHGKPERSRPAQKQDRVSVVEICGFCGEPAPTGRDLEGKSILRRVDDIPVHASPCYWTLASQAQRAGVPVTSHLATIRAQHAQRAKQQVA